MQNFININNLSEELCYAYELLSSTNYCVADAKKFESKKTYYLQGKSLCDFLQSFYLESSNNAIGNIRLSLKY